MKRIKNRCFAFILATLLLFSVAMPAFATDCEEEHVRASDYISYVYARTQIVGGIVQVYYRITGTGTMTSIGATDVVVYDHLDNCVAILYASSTPGMMGSNVGFYQNTVNCLTAVSGEHYYAIVGFKAEDATGYDTTSYMTPLIP